MTIGIELRDVSFAYTDGMALRNIKLSVTAGEMVGLLGPNGSGKTTLIKLASGIIRPNHGEILLDGTSLRSMSRKNIARSVAVVPQQFDIPFAFTTTDVVMLGRFPFIKNLSAESAEDKHIVSETMDIVRLSQFGERRFDELSGGERQKVILAMALAQQPKLLLLDEPTLHLDISHQIEILELVRRLNTTQKLTAVAAMHDLNLAALYFDRLILLKEGKIVADGTPSQVLTEGIISEVFATTVKVEVHPSTGAPHIVVMPKKHGQPL